jgi:hypothetical protein
MGLAKLEEQNEQILKEVSSLKTELAVHKVKSGFWGALMGAIVAIGSKLLMSGSSH